MNAMSLFTGAGIGETYLQELGIDTILASELLEERAELYKYRYPKVDMLVGDIQLNKELLITKGKQLDLKLLMATPPCQGMSQLGKRDYENDIRNYLIFDVFDIIDALNFDYIFIENVPKFLKMVYPYKNVPTEIMDILRDKYGDTYDIKADIFDAADYGVPQRRKRAIIRLFRKGLVWKDPIKQSKITLQQAIGHLPSIEAGQSSGIKYHDGPKTNAKYIEMLKHTPSGKSAFDNEFYYPKRDDGKRVSGYHNTYRRLDWNEVCPTRTMKSNSISGSNNCHPGRPYVDKVTGETLYSDARAMSLLELFIVTSLPIDIDLPDDIREGLIRDVIGEGIPPLLVKNIMKGII